MGKFTSFKLLLLLFLSVINLDVFSQQWVDLMKDSAATFQQVQTAFNTQWQGLSYQRGQGYKQYKRWEYFVQDRILPDGTFPRQQRELDDFRQAITTPLALKGGGAGNWQPNGPFDHVNTDSWSSGQGRVNYIIEDPNDANTIFVGSPSGGIWKSTDAGSSWTPLGDQLSVIGISGIAIDYANSDIIYIATGDRDGGDTYSIGILKSIDGGTSWSATGSLGGQTNDVIIDPTNSSIVWAATSNGIYKSTNAGVSWTNLRSGNFDDIELKPGDPQTVYGVTDDRFYRTTNGSTFTQITSGLPNNSGRLGIGVTPANSSYVYVLSATTGNGFQGIYRSTNSGTSFTARNTTTDIFESTQAWYDMAIGVSDTDENLVFTGVLNVWESSNGGTSWSQVNSWSNPAGASYTHADIHFLKYYNGSLYCGSDGGIYKSTDDGNNFTDLTPGIQIGQFYRIGGSQNDNSVLAGGLQDNGGYFLTGGTWKCWYGADGMEAQIDPNNSNNVYGMIQYGGLYRSTNGGNTNQGLGDPGVQGNWVTPMQMDQNNPRIVAGYDDLYEFTFTGGWNQLSNYNFPANLRNIEIYEGNSDIMYISTSQSFYRTTNDGANITNLTGSLPNLNGGENITSIEVNPNNSNEVWISISGWNAANHVHHSTDGGSSWTNITDNLPNLPCNIIKYDNGTNGGIYLGTDIGIYYRDDNLGTWIEFSNNLPNVLVYDLEINEATSTVKAGTYGRGVWESPAYILNQYDAGVIAITSPTGTLCGTTFDPVVTLFNYGSDVLTTVTITYDIDGTGAQVYNWTGSLSTGASTDITLPTMTTTAGAHVFNAVTSSPNGQTDEDATNDLGSSSFTSVANGNEVELTIVTDCWGSETEWLIQDASSATVFSGGPYGDVNGGQTLSGSFCLADGCYTFIINDSYGDGLNGIPSGCSVDGNYFIRDGVSGDTLVLMDVVNFVNQATHNFCVPNISIDADFSGDDLTICAGQSVNFTDASVGAITGWNWTFTGGTPASSTNQNPSNVVYSSAGTYAVSLQVTDGVTNNTETKTMYVSVTDNPSASAVEVPVLCNGESTGEINVTATGGQSGYSFLWSNGATDADITGLAQGAYVVTIQDANLCMVTASYNVTEPIALGTGIVGSDVTCGLVNGSATASPTGGSGSYSYTWSSGGNSSTETGLSSGSVSVTVEDSNFCTVTSSVSIGVSPGPSLTTSVTHGTCADSNGTGTAIITGGNSPYVYAWSNGSNNQTAIGLGAGSYGVTVVDGASCTVTSSANITVSSAIVSNASFNDATCGINNGSASVTVMGGTAPYAYSWSNGANVSVTTGLSANSYSVTVTDAFNCTSIETGSVAMGGAPTLTKSVWDATCGSSNGSISVTTNGGATPYTYNWSSGGTAANEVGLGFGNYTVTVTDANNCTVTTSQIVSNSTPIAPVVTTDATCGLDNGIGDARPSGGFPPYDFNWSFGGTNQVETGLSPGVYTVTVTDDTSCVVITSITITATSAPVISTITTSSTCGLANGSAGVNIAGGITPFVYNWSSGGVTSTESGLIAGNYTVTVSDFNLCTVTSNISVSGQEEPNVFMLTTDVSCGSSNGTAAAILTSGTTPFTYAWSNGESVASINNLPVNIYGVTITDGNGCTAVTSGNVNSIGGAMGSITSTDATCGSFGGSATLSITGGSTPYSYSWSNGSTSMNLNNVVAGNYAVTVIDASTCAAVFTTEINDLSNLALSVTSMDANCGGANGQATVSVIGVTTPFTYTWSSGGVLATETGLSAGGYSISVLDVSGCLAVESVTIGDISGPIVALSVTDEACTNGNGMAQTTVIGGQSPYTFLWSDGSSGVDANNLSSGPIAVTVQDDLGCVAVGTSTVFNSAGPTLAISVTDASCTSANGQATAIVSGGTSPFVFNWSSGGTTQMETGIAGGAYFVTVIDFNGCIASNSVVVENVQHTVTSSTLDANCGQDNGQIELDVIGGGAPYSYIWNTGNTNQVLSNLGAGSYTVTVFDANACSVVLTEIIDSISTPQVAVSVQNELCDQGNGSALVQGGGGMPPYTYSWSGIVNGVDSLQENLEAGVYSVFVTDDLGCLVSSLVIIGNYSAPSISVTTGDAICQVDNGFASVSVEGGSAPFEYFWSTDEATDSIVNLAEGEYTVTVTDANNCEVSDTAIVGRLDGICINPPSGFSPNGDGVNDVWNIDGALYYPELSVEVFNRWGSLLYSSVGYDEPWSGLNRDGREVPAAVYYYVVKLGEEHRTGTVTIKR